MVAGLPRLSLRNEEDGLVHYEPPDTFRDAPCDCFRRRSRRGRSGDAERRLLPVGRDRDYDPRLWGVMQKSGSLADLQLSAEVKRR